MKSVRNLRVLNIIPLMFIMLLICQYTYGKVIYVDDDAVGANNGSSWTDAYNYLQDALADAKVKPKPIEIHVADGIYKPDQGPNQTSGDRESTFQLIDGLTLKGGFAGSANSKPNTRDLRLYETVLSGDLTGNDFDVNDASELGGESKLSENSLHVVIGTGTGEIAVIDGLTIVGGYAHDPATSGGGIYNVQGSLTLIGCELTRNYAYSAGAGIYIYNGSVSFKNCSFTENHTCEGGGIYGSESTLILDGCMFSRNSVSSRWSSRGAYWGGLGAGIFIKLSNFKMENSNLTRNIGDGMRIQASDAVIAGCIFSGNSSQGISCWGGRAVVTNCTFDGNRGYPGYALACTSSSVTTSDVLITNCIIGNGSGAIWRDDDSTISVAYCDVQGGWPGEGNIDADPCFAQPGYWDDGGTTNHSLEWIDGDYHLISQAGRWDTVSRQWVIDQASSPCIDAGDPKSPVPYEPFPNGGVINMGAYGGTMEASKSPSGLHARYGGGAGEPNEPYLIYTAEHLNTIGADPNDWGKDFKLMADLDLSTYAPDQFNIIGIDSNIAFVGVFDGNGHTILNFCYTCQGTNNVGFFGCIDGGQVKDLGLVNPVIEAETSERTGSLVGYLMDGTVERCYVWEGSLRGYAMVGGLVGQTGSSQSWDDREPWGSWGVIVDCYSTCDVTGDRVIGGLVGKHEEGFIARCYSAGRVRGQHILGGLVGEASSQNIWGSFWDVQTSGQEYSAGGTKKKTEQMWTTSTFIREQWDFVDETENGTEDIWRIDEGQDYPRLSWETAERPMFGGGTGEPHDPYLIYTAEQMNKIGTRPHHWNKHFKLMTDIDVGNYASDQFDIIEYFTGQFDGNGHVISNFSYTSPYRSGTGLFAYVDNPNAQIKNLGLVDPNIDAGIGDYVGSLVGHLAKGTLTNCYAESGTVTGLNSVGGLVGTNNEGSISTCYSTNMVSGNGGVGGLVGNNNEGSISICYSTSMVSGNGNVGGLVGSNSGVLIQSHSTGVAIGQNDVGGLVGYNVSDVLNCYSTALAKGTQNVGGLVGSNGGNVTHCYSADLVTGSSDIGGLVGCGWVWIAQGRGGRQQRFGHVIDSLWDTQTSDQPTSTGGTGKTTAEMQTASTFLEAGWDFVDETVNGTDDIWWMPEDDYPRLWWETYD